MSYSNRFKYFFTFRPLRAFDEIEKAPNFFRTSVQTVIIGSVVFSFLFQYTMANVMHAYWQSLWIMIFFSLWALPSLTSLLILKLRNLVFKKSFNTEAYLESLLLSSQPVGLALNIYLISAILYHHVIVGDYPAYVAYARMGEWYWIVGMGAAGFLLYSVLAMLAIWRVAKVKWYLAPFVWLFSIPSLYGTYFLYVGLG